MDRNAVKILVSCFIACICISGCENSAEKKGCSSRIEKGKLGPEIAAECVVNIFDTEKGKYVTNHQHRIYPEALAMRVEGEEPAGHFDYMLTDGRFSKSGSGEDNISSDIAKTGYSREIAGAIVLSIAARSGFLGKAAGSAGDSVSINGRRYEPFRIACANANDLVKTIYREESSNKIDWCEVKNPNNGVLIAARSYNIRNLSGSDEKVVPTTIDIYNTDSSGRPSDIIMNINYTSFEIVSEQ